jgi:hypothetical protein
MKLIALILVTMWAMASGCANTQPTTNTATLPNVVDLSSNTGQNFQAWPDGSVQAGSTQLDSGVISPDTTNWQGTAVSGILAVTKNGVQVKNPGNLDADSLEIVFGEPVADADGTLIVPIATITISGLTNEVTSVIDASTEQVTAWVGVLSQLSADQRDVALAELEAQRVITAETAGMIRAALEAASPVP